MRAFVPVVAGAVLVEAGPNPIRRVVTLMQEMQAEIEGEVAKEKEQYKKFQCYCKKNDGSLSVKAEEAAAVIKSTRAAVDGLTGQKKQLEEELKKHKKDRKEAEKKLTAATKERTEDKKKYDEATKEQKKTLDDIDSAINALQKGMGKSFLQTGAAQYLRHVMDSNSAAMSMLDVSDQEVVASFLESSKDYAPQGGEIVGILKMMKDNFDESLGGIVKQEETAVKAFAELKRTLQDLIKAAGRAIEKKAELKGETAVKIVEGKNLISTTEKQMGEDMATAAELKDACANKGDEFKTRQEDAAAEVEAIGQAIGILNNDDALDLFKKTDTKADSFIQMSASKNSPVAVALNELSQKFDSPAISMLAFAARQNLKTGKVDFSKVLKMVDDMIVLLKKEAEDDQTSRDNCTTDLRDSDDDKKDATRTINAKKATIENLEGVVANKAAVIAKSTDDISAAKTSMAEATKQRQDDNADFVETVSLNNQAVELVGKAKMKLQLFYNPHLVSDDAKAQMEATENAEAAAAAAADANTKLAEANAAFIQLHVQQAEQKLPEGQPEVSLAGNKGAKGGSVMALMDMIVGDLNKDTQAMESDEQRAQSDYEHLSSDLSKQVASSQKALNEATASKAKAEDDKQTAESELDMTEEELAGINQTIVDLHAKCDFILANFEERKAARETEVSGLGKAKAILAGAKFD